MNPQTLFQQKGNIIVWQPTKIEKYDKRRVVASWSNCIDIDHNKNNEGLRTPQRGALYSILAHKTSELNEIPIVVMPTGTGKTEVIFATIFKLKLECSFILVPTDALREQVSSKCVTVDVLRSFKILSRSAENFSVCKLVSSAIQLDSIKEIIEKSNVIVTTVSLYNKLDTTIRQYIANKIDGVFVDEAHHVPALTWSSIVSEFSNNKVVLFTATPFREDKKIINAKVIYKYPLKKAQEEGYFSTIDFVAVKEYDPQNSDIKVAKKAIEILKNEHQIGNTDTVLMARCSTQAKAEKITIIYLDIAKEYEPVCIHSGMPTKIKENNIKLVKNGTSKIVICVDMLGEGFDLPTLKIAAFHDVRKSLAITLQLVGRFTRTNHSCKIGHSKIIANILDVNINKKVSELYAEDSDWNLILRHISEEKISEQVKEYEFVKSTFDPRDLENFSVQNIRPKFSFVAYKVSGIVDLNEFYKGIIGYEKISHKKVIHGLVGKYILIFIYSVESSIEWGNIVDITNVTWEMIILYYNSDQGLLYINSTENNNLYKGIAKAVSKNSAIIIEKDDVFKVLNNIKNYRIYNIGTSFPTGRDTRFRISFGYDVIKSLDNTTKGTLNIANFFASGYEFGEIYSIGASTKGRIWQMKSGSLFEFIKFCNSIGVKLIDSSVDGLGILKNTMRPLNNDQFPESDVMFIDFHESYYFDSNNYDIIYKNNRHNFNMLCFEVKSFDKNTIKYKITTENKEYSINVVASIIKERDRYIVVHKLLSSKVYYASANKYNSKSFFFQEYLDKYPPSIHFVDNTVTSGHEMFKLPPNIGELPSDKLEAISWLGYNIGSESFNGSGKTVQDRIYKYIKDNYSPTLVFNDDSRGEIADLIVVEDRDDYYKVTLFHCKYAPGGNVTSQINQFYEVCGQAQKSSHWKHQPATKLFGHLIRRTNLPNGNNRVLIGEVKDINSMYTSSERGKAVKYEIIIVQPGCSIHGVTSSIRELLGATVDAIKVRSNIDVRIIVNDSN